MKQNQNKCLEMVHFNDCYELETAARFYAELLKHGWENKLKLFSGDLFFPSILSLTFRGKPVEKFFELLNIDYAVIGNHEIDEGLQLFEDLIRPYPTKWLLCNYKHSQNQMNLANALEFDIFERGGFSIGIFGTLDKFWIEASIPLPNFEYIDFKPKIKEVSRILKQKGCDLIICLTHMATASDEEALEIESDVDIFLGGHEHVYFVKHANNKVLLKSGSDYQMFSNLSLSLDDSPLSDALPDNFTFKLRRNLPNAESHFAFSLPRNEKFLNVKISKVGVEKEGPVYQPFFDYWMEQNTKLEKKLKVPAIIVETAQSLCGSLIRKEESGIANLITDVTRIVLGLDFSIHNAGAIRSTKVLSENDDITLMDMRQFEPFQAPLHRFELPGEAIVTLLNQSYSALPGEHGRFLHFSGFKAKAFLGRDPIVAPEDVLVHGKPIELKKIYTASTPDFISGGRDGLSVLEEFSERIFEGSTCIFDVLFEFSELPESSKNREEFALFKSSLPDITDQELDEVNRQNFNKENLKDSLNELQKPKISREDLLLVDSECLKRLRLYSLAKSIEEREQRFVFCVSGKTEGRLMQIDHKSL